MSSILFDVLEGVGQGLGVDQDKLDALRKLTDPEAFETRENMATALVEGIGYDPENYWNRKEFGAIYDASHEDSDGFERNRFIDAAIDRFSNLRDVLLNFVAINGNEVKTLKLYGDEAAKETNVELLIDMADINDIAADEEPMPFDRATPEFQIPSDTESEEIPDEDEYPDYGDDEEEDDEPSLVEEAEIVEEMDDDDPAPEVIDDDDEE